MAPTPDRTYLALGDSMSIDRYTGELGGGAVAQFHRGLGAGWRLDDRTKDGCLMEGVPSEAPGQLITLTIGGNNLFFEQNKWLEHGLAAFKRTHLELLHAIRRTNPDATLIVGNVYAPQFALDPKRAALLDEANEAIGANVSKVGARLADIRSRFRGHEEELLCQLIEPNLKGARAIADLFQAAMG